MRNISKYLNDNDIAILNGDFETATQNAKRGDLVYFDPPYVPLSPTESFTGYTADGFGYEEQVRLRDLFVDLTKRGVYVIVSNSSAELVYELYKPFAKTILKSGQLV